MVGTIVFLRASEERLLVAKVNVVFFPLSVHLLRYLRTGLGGTAGLAPQPFAASHQGLTPALGHE